MLLFTAKELKRTFFTLIALVFNTVVLSLLVTHAPFVGAFLLLVTFAIAAPILNMYVENARDRYKEFQSIKPDSRGFATHIS